MRAARGAVSRWTAVLMIGLLALALTYAGDAQILLPGPLISGHAAVEECGTCHTTVGNGQFAWLQAIVAPSDAHKDAKACLSCHQVVPEALAAHGEMLDRLETMTERLRTTAAAEQTPMAGVLREAVFPKDSALSDGIFCATCHKEHQGEAADLSAVPTKLCQACHAVQFDSFLDGHPDFTDFPFRRRTRVNFDHVSHFGEHFPKTRAKDTNTQPTPSVCGDCHQLASDKKHMDVKPFKTVCSNCHLHQIVGTERLSSHQGMAFLTLPGLDLDTLAERGVSPGQWPRGSEAKVTPFMALLIGREPAQRVAMDLVQRLNLKDLSGVSELEIQAVQWFAWQAKILLHALSTSKPSETLERLSPGSAPDPELMAQLTAHLPRDVVIGAIREWLPNLESELAAHRLIDLPEGVGALEPAAATFPTQPPQTGPSPQDDTEDASLEEGEAEPDTDEDITVDDESDILSEDELEEAEAEAEEDASDDGEEILSGDEDLEDEEEEEEAEEAQEEQPESEKSKVVDAQTWAEFGGWYRQDFAILYKPTGHADDFFRAWFDHSGGMLTNAPGSAADAVFAVLTDSRAQGQCTKCHSIDAGDNGARKVNWGTATQNSKAGRFTVFAHEPHFGFPGENGCFTCHQLDETAQYQKGFEDHDPTTFFSNFKPMRKDQCAACHTTEAAGTDCLTCHEYHVHDVTTPIMSTKVPEK